jgi:uncharacterized protein (DUF362 family)
MTRRRLLRLLGLTALTAGVTYQTRLHRQLLRLLDRTRAPVALVPCAGYGKDLPRQLARAWELGRGPSVRGLRVLLKPNLVDTASDRPINTDARFLAALADLLRERGAREILVAEGPGNRRDIDTVLGETGLGDVLAARKVAFTDLNTDDLSLVQAKTIELPEPSRIAKLFLPVSLLRADLVISVAKLKTHHWTGVTLSLKNLFGVVPGTRYGWPKNLLHWNGIDRSVLELYKTVRPGFALIDGIAAMEGDGPLNGKGREPGLIFAGADLVALDATAARAMGVRPESIQYLAAAEELDLGRLAERRIEVVGEPLEKHIARFELPKGFEHMRG